MKAIEKTLRLGLVALLIVAGGDVFLRYFDISEPSPAAQEFLISLTAAGYIWPAVGCVFLVGAILLCFKKFVGLALVLLFPVLTNMILFHVFLDRAMETGLKGPFLCLVYLVVMIINRQTFRSLVGT